MGSSERFSANSFRQGVDAAVQITMDRPEQGGLSGACLEEAVSWSKVKEAESTVTVICDATIAFPLIIASALEHCRTRQTRSMERANLN